MATACVSLALTAVFFFAVAPNSPVPSMEKRLRFTLLDGYERYGGEIPARSVCHKELVCVNCTRLGVGETNSGNWEISSEYVVLPQLEINLTSLDDLYCVLFLATARRF